MFFLHSISNRIVKRIPHIPLIENDVMDISKFHSFSFIYAAEIVYCDKPFTKRRLFILAFRSSYFAVQIGMHNNSTFFKCN